MSRVTTAALVQGAGRGLGLGFSTRSPRVLRVDTDLSRPFQRGVAPGTLLDADQAAALLLAIIGSLTPKESGSFFDGRREPIPW